MAYSLILSYDTNGCALKGLKNLPIYLWTEGFGAVLALKMADKIDKGKGE